MPNRNNLIPNHERTPKERRENARKAGIASGKARRRKANLKRTMETLLKMDVPDSNFKDKLIEMGIDPSMEQGLVLNVLLTAMQSGDHQAFRTIRETIQQTTTLADRREQRARTEKIQAEAELMKQDELGADVLDDGFLDALEGKAGELWQEQESQED